MDFSLRIATPADAQAITTLINQYIAHTTTTFITEPQTVKTRLAWFRQRSRAFPAIAAEHEGALVGWGALSPHNPRGAYRHTAELSVYVDPRFHRRGLGRALLTELIARARAANHHALIAVCCTESIASIGLHEALGFVRVGQLREVGRKFNRWLDIVYLELLL